MEIAAASFPGIYLMGMCSRQERIQKDIDIVIQKSRAEKDCLFAGEFLSPGSWDPEPAFPPATPLPRFLTATRAAWVGGSVGLQVPVPGAFGNSCSGVSWSSKEEGGTSPLSPAPPALTGQGSLGLRGQQNPGGRSAGAGRWIPATGAAQSILPAPAAAAEQAGLRLRPNGGGREGTGCAALRCSARRHRGPGRRQRWAELPPPWLHPLLGERTHTAPETEWIPGAPELCRPSLGVPSRPSLHPRGREQFGLQPEAWLGLLPAALLGNSRRCHGTRHLLRGADSRCTPPGARHPLPHRSCAHPSFSSPLFPPNRASLAQMK